MAEFSKNLTKRVMRRIYGIWFLKRVAPVMFLEMPLLAIIALSEAAREFFWVRIIENFSASLNGGVTGALNFVGHALYSAPALPLAIIGFSAGLFTILAYKTFRNFKSLVLVEI